jgi:hypothetical protein
VGKQENPSRKHFNPIQKRYLAEKQSIMMISNFSVTGYIYADLEKEFESINPSEQARRMLAAMQFDLSTTHIDVQDRKNKYPSIRFFIHLPKDNVFCTKVKVCILTCRNATLKRDMQYMHFNKASSKILELLQSLYGLS